MSQTIAITQEWQIYIPIKFRQVLGLAKPGLAEMKVVDDALLVRPKMSPILKIAGKYSHRKPIKKINLERIREEIDYSQL